jgi:hypothetical protein
MVDGAFIFGFIFENNFPNDSPEKKRINLKKYLLQLVSFGKALTSFLDNFLSSLIVLQQRSAHLFESALRFFQFFRVFSLF